MSRFSASDVESVETVLAVALPTSYRNFLLQYGSARLNGLPVVGLPLSPGPESAWGCTELVRALRPDLGLQLVGIRLLDSRVLALDIESGNFDDAPLVEIDLAGTEAPRPVHASFARYVSECEKADARIEGALRRVRRHLETAASRNRIVEHAKRTSLPKPHDWRVFRSCVHDQVIALTAIRQNEQLNALEVDVFISTDHPDYEPGHGTQAAALLLLADAYRFGTSMAIHFTRYSTAARRRVPDRIPREILALAERYRIALRNASDGIIQHSEAAELYAALAGLDAAEREALSPWERAGRMSLSGLSFLLGTRLWLRHEVLWLLRNAPRPDGVLYGADLPEDRLAFRESIAVGRAALATTKLVRMIAEGGDELTTPCILTPRGLAWDLECQKSGRLHPLSSEQPLELTPGDRLTVLARPRDALGIQATDIEEDVKILNRDGTPGSPKVLVYTTDLANRFRDHAVRLGTQLRDRAGIHLVLLPHTAAELDQEVEERMSRARRIRP